MPVLPIAEKIISYLPHKAIAILAITGCMVGLVTTRVVLSVASITLACNALLHPDVLRHFREWLRQPQKVLFTLLFLAFALSGLYSDNVQEWWSNTQNKLPLLAIPFGFTYVERRFKERKLLWPLLFAGVMLISGLAVMGNFLLHYEAISESIKLGNAIPTPMNDHIRFSMAMAFSVVLGLWLLGKSRISRNRILLYAVGMALAIQFIILHFLAVRSGLAVAYGSLFLYIIHLIVRRRNLVWGLSAMAVFILSLVLAFSLITPLKNKYSYFKYEWELIARGEYKEGHSDAQRVISILLGWEVAREHLPWGTGTGDIRQAMADKYLESDLTDGKQVELPHNQFIYNLASIGVAGTILLIAAFFYPLARKELAGKWLMQSFLLLLLISFMTEHALQIQIGMTFIMLFSCLLPMLIKKPS